MWQISSSIVRFSQLHVLIKVNKVVKLIVYKCKFVNVYICHKENNMEIFRLKELYLSHKESSLSHRYITNKNIEPLLDKLRNVLIVEALGKSVLGKPIYGLKIG